MSAIIDLQARIATLGLGLTSGTNLFRYLMPPSPDIAVALYLYDSLPPEHDLGGGLPGTLRAEYPMIQVVARGIPDDGDGPSAMLKSIVDDFTKIGATTTTMSGKVYQSVSALQTPFFRNRDDQFRQHWVVNFEVMKDY